MTSSYYQRTCKVINVFIIFLSLFCLIVNDLKMARTIDNRPYKSTFQSFATGHHTYKDIWSPIIGEMVLCERELNNQYDQHAVRLIVDGRTVGHVPREISRACSYILTAGGSMYGVVTGGRENRRQNGLEVPIKYHVKGPQHHMLKAEALVVLYYNLT